MKKRSYTAEYKAKIVMEMLREEEHISVRRQCELLGISRSAVYYKGKEKTKEAKEREEYIKSRLDYWHTQQCYLGARRLRDKLRKEEKIKVGRKLVKRYMEEMGIYINDYNFSRPHAAHGGDYPYEVYLNSKKPVKSDQEQKVA